MKQKHIVINKEGPKILPDSIQAKIHPEISNTNCWILSNSTRKHPGHYAVKQWVLCYGQIPKNLNVLHKCDNVNGPNPEHLFLGTPSENLKDCIIKNRFRNGCTSSTAKKAWLTRLKNGNIDNFISSSEKAKKAVETKKKNGIKLGLTSEQAKKSWDTKRKKGEGNGEKFVSAAKKGWLTRRKNGNGHKFGNQHTKANKC